jgi:hypothetical protein
MPDTYLSTPELLKLKDLESMVDSLRPLAAFPIRPSIEGIAQLLPDCLKIVADKDHAPLAIETSPSVSLQWRYALLDLRDIMEGPHKEQLISIATIIPVLAEPFRNFMSFQSFYVLLGMKLPYHRLMRSTPSVCELDLICGVFSISGRSVKHMVLSAQVCQYHRRKQSLVLGLDGSVRCAVDSFDKTKLEPEVP